MKSLLLGINIIIASTGLFVIPPTEPKVMGTSDFFHSKHCHVNSWQPTLNIYVLPDYKNLHM